MTTLYDRLVAIAYDMGRKRVNGRVLEEITGLSNSRISQIKSKGEAARVGSDVLAKLVNAGYAPDYIKTGRLPMKYNLVSYPEDPPRLIHEVSETEATYQHQNSIESALGTIAKFAPQKAKLLEAQILALAEEYVMQAQTSSAVVAGVNQQQSDKVVLWNLEGFPQYSTGARKPHKG